MPPVPPVTCANLLFFSQDKEDCTMAEARISPYLPPNIDPTKAPVAFGDRALAKLNEELGDPELLTRQRALMALCDLLHDPEHVCQAVHLGKSCFHVLWSLHGNNAPLYSIYYQGSAVR